MNKQFYKSNFAKESFLQNSIEYVLNEISNLMKVCYGPYGSHVLIANKIGAEALKDGQRILSSYIPSSSIPTTVIQSIKSVSNKQAEEIGDGTTTTILLLCELYKSFKAIINKYKISPSIFNKVLKKVVDDLLAKIETKKINIIENDQVNWDLLRDAIYTSVDANDDLTNIIIDMYKELNSIDPLIIIDTSSNDYHRYELVKGIELDGYPIMPEIFFNGYSRKDMNSPEILIINGKLDLSVEYIMELDNISIRENRQFVFICSGIDDDKLSTLVTLKNTNPALLNNIVFFQSKMTMMNDEFLDACVALGANPIDSETLNKISSLPALLKLIDMNHGNCEKTLITEFCIRFNDPKSDTNKINQRIEEIDVKINDIKNDPTSHNTKLKELENRKAFLSKNFAKLYVGGTSPQRRSINYELAKDGVLQASSCLKHGVVNGCNTLIPSIYKDILSLENYEKNYTDTFSELNEYITYYYMIMNVISNSYLNLYKTILSNKNIDTDIDINNINLDENVNIRDNDNTLVLNSAATDITILKNATDMAALLATSKAFLSNTPEFDSLNNQ